MVIARWRAQQRSQAHIPIAQLCQHSVAPGGLAHMPSQHFLGRKHVLLQEKTATRLRDHVFEARQLRCSHQRAVDRCVNCRI